MIIQIYKATSPSGKCYIGLTNNFERRKQDHIYKAYDECSYKNKYRFKQAILKHGHENIMWEIIDSAKDYDTARELEKRYILHFNSWKNGYNMSCGGEYCEGEPKKWTKEVILKDVKQYKTRNAWKKGSKGGYDAARRFKKFDENFYNKCVKHMVVINKLYTLEDIQIAALKFTHSNQWKIRERKTWDAATKYRRKQPELYKKIISHFKKK